jgi:hypothetical protein
MVPGNKRYTCDARFGAVAIISIFILFISIPCMLGRLRAALSVLHCRLSDASRHQLSILFVFSSSFLYDTLHAHGSRTAVRRFRNLSTFTHLAWL